MSCNIAVRSDQIYVLKISRILHIKCVVVVGGGKFPGEEAIGLLLRVEALSYGQSRFKTKDKQGLYLVAK